MATNSLQQQVQSIATNIAQSVTAPLLGFLWSWFKRIVPLFVLMLVLLSVLLSAYTFYARQRDRQLKLFVGPMGTSGGKQVELIEQELRRGKSFVGPNYFVTEISTGGYAGNLRSVNRDQEGNVVGLVTEGIELDDSANIRTLLPLQWSYLHFVYRTGSLKFLHLELQPRTGESVAPISLSDWADAYRKAHAKYKEKTIRSDWPQRLYLGPPNSGTRQLASSVLSQMCVLPSDVDATGISDFDEMLLALKHGRIDGAFFVGPLNSSVIREIAEDHDNPCTLLSFDDDKLNRLLEANSYIQKGTIYSHVYPFTYPSHDGFSRLDVVQTLALRRVLVASSYMTDEDAHYLSGYFQKALGRDVAGPDKDGRFSSPNDNSDRRLLNYTLHSGVDLTSDTRPRINWFFRNTSWLGPLLLAMTISLVTELKNRIPTWLDRHHLPPQPPDKAMDSLSPPPTSGATAASTSHAPPPNQPSPAYGELESQLDALYFELMDAYDSGNHFSKQTITAWNKRLELMLHNIRQLRGAGKLSRNDVEALHQVGSKLRQMLESLRLQSLSENAKRSTKSEQSPPTAAARGENLLG